MIEPTAEDRARELVNNFTCEGSLCGSPSALIHFMTAAIHAGSNAELERKRAIQAEFDAFKAEHSIEGFGELQNAIMDWLRPLRETGLVETFRIAKFKEECLELHEALTHEPENVPNELGDVGLAWLALCAVREVTGFDAVLDSLKKARLKYRARTWGPVEPDKPTEHVRES